MVGSPFFRAAVIGGAVSAAAAGVVAADRWRRMWGVDPGDAVRPLPGDDVVPAATFVDTRAVTIEAPPEQVWPWLVQMGFGRGGWYSYDQLDMDRPSATTIVPEWQSLAVGDVVATDPGGGFVVRAIEPHRSLVLFADTAMFAGRERPAAGAIDAAADAPGLAASGRFLETAMPPEFAASWAFVLEPLDGGRRTRFIERFRGWFGAATPGSRMLGPALGFGVFVMMRKQMLGIRDRVEDLAFAAPSDLTLPEVAAPVA